MKVIIGTHNGMMKVVNLDENAQMNLFGRYELNNAVETLCWGDPDSGEDLVGAGFSHGDVQFWNPITQKLIFDCGRRAGKVKGLYTFARESGRMVVSCTHNSQLNICPMDIPKDYEHKPIRLEGNNDSAIWRMRPNPLSEQKLLYAGYHIMPTLFDIEKSKTVWRGKFEQPKFYGIKQRQFFTDFQFLPDSASVFATGSRYREFRIYDLRKGTAPVLDFDVTQAATWEFAMISLSVTHHTPTIIYATEATGKIASFDMRTGRLHKVYRDGMGTVKSLAFHPTERVMGAVGLDRYLRVYDIDKRLQKLSDKISLQYRFRGDTMVGANMYNKMFLKQKLNAIMFFSEGRMKKKVQDDEIKEEGRDVEEEDTKEDVKDNSIILEEGGEDVWENLEQVGDVKDEEDDDLLEVKKEPEDEDDTPKKSALSRRTRVKEEDEDEDDEDDEDGFEDGEDEDDEDEDDEDGEGEDDGEVAEGEFKLGEFAEAEEESEEEDLDDEKSKKPKKAPQHTRPGSSTDNKRVKRLAKEKEEKKKEKKRKKTSAAFAKKQRLMSKKRKTLGK